MKEKKILSSMKKLVKIVLSFLFLMGIAGCSKDEVNHEEYLMSEVESAIRLLGKEMDINSSSTGRIGERLIIFEVAYMGTADNETERTVFIKYHNVSARGKEEIGYRYYCSDFPVTSEKHTEAYKTFVPNAKENSGEIVADWYWYYYSSEEIRSILATVGNNNIYYYKDYDD